MVLEDFCCYTQKPSAPFNTTRFQRESLSPEEVRIGVHFSGICRRDIDLWSGFYGEHFFPFVPGHEVVGEVIEAGQLVSGLRVGDWVSVGAEVGSCRLCVACATGNPQRCPAVHFASVGRKGGLSSHIVVPGDFALPFDPSLHRPEEVGALRCSGLPVYRALKAAQALTRRIAVVGLGGAGHLAVQFSREMGFQTHVFSTNAAKREDALRLGAAAFKHVSGSNSWSPREAFDLVLYCASAPMELDPLVRMVRPGGAIAIVGHAGRTLRLSTLELARMERSVLHYFSGNDETLREMMGFALAHGVRPQVEVFDLGSLNSVFERVVKSEIRYRAVVRVAR